MKPLYRIAGLLMLAAALAACERAGTSQQKFVATDITGGAWGKDFQLTDHNGQPRTIADFKGKAVVLFFGFINCPDVCPTTMFKLATTMEKLGKDAERVQVLMVSLDPKRDTREVLKKYVSAFHPTFLGLVGDEQQIEDTAREFKVIRALQKPDENGFYTVDHSGGLYTFDPQGRLRLYISDEHPADVISQDLKTLMNS